MKRVTVIGGPRDHVVIRAVEILVQRLDQENIRQETLMIHDPREVVKEVDAMLVVCSKPENFELNPIQWQLIGEAEYQQISIVVITNTSKGIPDDLSRFETCSPTIDDLKAALAI